MSETGSTTRQPSRSVWWLTVALVAAHFVFGVGTEIATSRVLRVLSLVAAGLAVLAALLGMYLVYSDRDGRAPASE